MQTDKKYTERQIIRQAGMQDRQARMQVDVKKNRQTNRQRQTERQTDR